MGDRYVLSVWENHGDASKWLFDICDEQFFLSKTIQKAVLLYAAVYRDSCGM